MSVKCLNYSASLPGRAGFCSRCGSPTGAAIAVKETPEGLMRQMASMLKKHAEGSLAASFVGPWGFAHDEPRPKTKSVKFNSQFWIFETGLAFVVTPLQGRLLFHDGRWEDIRVRVFKESGFDGSRKFAEAYRAQTGRNVEIVKNFV